jgi:hypothetical protein
MLVLAIEFSRNNKATQKTPATPTNPKAGSATRVHALPQNGTEEDRPNTNTHHETNNAYERQTPAKDRITSDRLGSAPTPRPHGRSTFTVSSLERR